MSPVCSGSGNEREEQESLPISKGDVYLPAQLREQQKVFFRIDNPFTIEDQGQHSGALNICSVSREK